MSELNEVKAQRDALLAALIMLKEAVEYTPLGIRGIKAVAHANTLIPHPASGMAAGARQ